MKKSLIALAVAGAISSPAFAATSNVDIYGQVSFALESTSNDFPLGSAFNPGINDDLAVVDRVSRIGFKGSEDLGGGLKAIWQIEQQINATSTSPQNNNTAFGGSNLRNTFIGLSSSEWGTVLMGRHDTPYKLATRDIFVDSIADYNNTFASGGTSAVALIDATQDYRSPQAIAYVSPTWSGFHFAGALIASANSANGNVNSGDGIDAWSVMGMYENGPLFLSGAYQEVQLFGKLCNNCDSSQAYKLAGGFNFGDFTVGGIYENVSNFDGLNDRDSWLANGTFKMGNIVFKGQYGSVNTDIGDGSQWTVGADYNFSKRTFAYLTYVSSDNDRIDNVDGWALGMKHSF